MPKLFYFGSNDEGRGKRDLSDLSKLSPTKQPPKKGRLLKLAYEEAAKYMWLEYVFLCLLAKIFFLSPNISNMQIS